GHRAILMALPAAIVHWQPPRLHRISAAPALDQPRRSAVEWVFDTRRVRGCDGQGSDVRRLGGGGPPDRARGPGVRGPSAEWERGCPLGPAGGGPDRAPAS